MKKIKQFLVPILMTLMVILGISPHSMGQGTQVFSTPGASTFIVPPGVASVTIKVWGAGGGGGSTATIAQGGGGGGGFVQVNQTSVLAGFSCPVTVGAGGAPGVNGGSSSCSANPLAMGGQAGTNIGGFGGGAYGAGNLVPSGPTFNSPLNFNGGDAGAATNPGSTFAGGGGGAGASAAGAGATGNNGGTSPNFLGGLGGSPTGGNGGDVGFSGINGALIGGGGGGRGNGATTISGSGADGRVTFTWPCPTLTSLTYPNASVVCSYSSALTATVLPATAIGGGYASVGNTLAGFLNASTGSIATGAPQGTHVIKYGWAAFGGCPADSVSFTLTIAPQAVANNLTYTSPLCNIATAGTVTPGWGASSGVAGVYTISPAVGLAINASTGVITPAGATAGTYTVTYTVAANGNCNAVTATSNSIVVTANPSISNFDYPPAGTPNKYCAGAGIQLPTSTVSNPNNNVITYTATPAGLSLTASTGAINPATSTPGVYVVTMSIAAGVGCAAVSATSTVEILARPTATIAYTGNPFCQTVASTLQPVSITGVTGGPLTVVNWTATPAGLTINNMNGEINLNSTPGVYTVKYRFTGVNGCLDSSTAPVTIYPRPKSTLVYTAGTNPVCSNVSPILSGAVTANGPWTLTLSNLQTVTGTGNANWTLTVNTLDPGETEVYTITSLVDVNCSGVANPDFPTSISITKRTTTSGVIPNAASIKVCENQDASVNVILTSPANNCAPNPQFSGVFRIEKWNGTSWVFQTNYSWTLSPGPSTSGIAAAITIPASLLPNPTSTTILYRVAWVSLTDCNGCTATPLTGTQVLEVVPVPLLTVSAAPIGDVCPGSNIMFDVFQASGSTIVGAMFNWVATDAQGNVVGSADNVTFGNGAINTNLGLSCPYNNTITFTITPLNPNCCNCLGIPITRTVVVRDIVAPTWTTVALLLDRTVECSDAAALALAQALKPVASDNCDNNVTNLVLTDSIVVANPNCPQAKTITKKWTVTDDCGNTSVKYTQVITILDTQAPLLVGTIPAGQININNCLSNAPTPPTAAAIAALFTDNCGTVSATLASVTTGTDCGWTVTHTYTVKDNCGNTVVVSPVIVYSGSDKTAPTIGTNTFPVGSANNNVCYNAVPVGPTEAAIAALYTDNCGGDITVVKTNVKTGDDCAWTIVYTYSIKDKCGNEVTPKPTVTYTGGDKTAPTLGNNTFPVGSANNNVCFNAVPVGPTEAAIALLYTDNCGGNITVVKTNVKTGDDCAWTIVYTYSIKDKCGNEVTPKPTVTYTGGDKTAPNLITAGTFPVGSANNNLCYNAVPVGPTEAAIMALYTDNCGGNITVVKTNVKTGDDCAWTIVYTYSIKDKCGNEVTPKPTVTYTGGDKTAPNLITAGTFPVGNTVSINGCMGSAPVGPSDAAIKALYTDNCGGTITVVKTGAPTGNACAWTVTYTYSIKDKCDNEVTPKPTVTYFGGDATAPVFAGIIPTQILNVGAFANCFTTLPNYTDSFNIRTTTFDCSMITYAQLAPNAPGTSVSGWGGYRDIVIEATDSCGNKSQTTFRLELKDLTAPNAICRPYTLVLNANGTGTITTANINNGSNDNCAGTTLTYSLSQTSFNCSNVGANTVTLSVTDQCQNTSTCTAVVTVVDNTAPVIECFGDTTVNKDANCTYTMPDMTFRVRATDACGIDTVTQNIPVGHVFAASQTSTVVVLTVKDNNGNTTTCSFTVNFRDVTPPVITGCPQNITVFTGLGRTTCNQIATWTPPVATDACTPCCQPGTPQQTITGNFAPGATFPVGVTTVTYTATDLSGNTSTCVFTVTVIDNTKPLVANCPANVSVNTGAGRATCDQTATWTEPTATDNCTAAASLVRYRSHAPGATFPVGVTNVKYAFTDAAGNTSDTCRFTVTVVDNTLPTITCPGNISNPPINTAGCLATLTTANPTFADNCAVTKLTWAITGVGIVPAATSPTTGINYLGSRTFNFGVTTVTYTATDAAGNSATCSYTVTVTRPFTAAISGTSTVLQNNTGTSNVLFTSQLGTAPYTIVYTTTAGGFPSAGTHTITTTALNSSVIGGNPNWLVTTVPQSSATPGSYTYTLVSVTDANGCVVTPNTTAVVTVIAATYPAPDLTPNIANNGSVNFAPAITKTGYLEIYNIPNGPGTNVTSGLVTFDVYSPSNFTLNIGAATTTIGATPVQNNQFDIVYYPGIGYAIQTKPGVVIASNTSLKIGYTVTATGGANNQGQFIVNIANQTGGVITAVGDNNDGNNNTLKTFKIIN